MNLASARQAWQLVSFQLIVSLIAFIILIFAGWVHAWSGLVGGLIAALANAFFALWVFAPYRAQEPGKVLSRLYGAEIQKLLLTGLLFAAAILWMKPLSPGALFGVFLLVQMAPVLIAHKLD